MGWLFSERWRERSELIKHLTEGNGLKTLKHCCKGNNLWCVHEYEKDGTPVRFVCLYMMKRPHNCGAGYTGNDKDWWGYKDVDESAGPYYYNCPLSYLDDLTEPDTGYSKKWRETVREYWRKANRKLEPGMKISVFGHDYVITGRPWRNGDYSVDMVGGANGLRLRRRYVKDVEVLL
jgi:hypothetical protein